MCAYTQYCERDPIRPRHLALSRSRSLEVGGYAGVETVRSEDEGCVGTWLPEPQTVSRPEAG